MEKNSRFSGRLRPDWGNTARAAMAGLGSIGVVFVFLSLYLFRIENFSPTTFPT